MFDSRIAPVRRPGTTLRVVAGIGLGLLLAGFLSLVWTPWPIDAVDMSGVLAGPGATHLLGTDQLGRDILSLTMRSLLTSLVIAGVGVALAGIGGVLLGLGAIRFRPLDLLRRGLDNLAAGFPLILVSFVILAALGPGGGVLMLAFGLSGISAFARATHAASTRLYDYDFVNAGRLAGLTEAEIWRRHVLADLVRAVSVTAFQLLAVNVAAEAALSFIGLGTQPPATSFGLMMRDAQAVTFAQPLLLLVPGLVICALVLLSLLAARQLARLVDPRLEVTA